MPLWGLAIGLGAVHLSLGLTLHALVTSKVRRRPLCVHSATATATATATAIAIAIAIAIAMVPLFNLR